MNLTVLKDKLSVGLSFLYANSLDFSSFCVLLFSMCSCLFIEAQNPVDFGIEKMNWRKELSG